MYRDLSRDNYAGAIHFEIYQIMAVIIFWPLSHSNVCDREGFCCQPSFCFSTCMFLLISTTITIDIYSHAIFLFETIILRYPKLDTKYSMVKLSVDSVLNYKYLLKTRVKRWSASVTCTRMTKKDYCNATCVRSMSTWSAMRLIKLTLKCIKGPIGYLIFLRIIDLWLLT